MDYHAEDKFQSHIDSLNKSLESFKRCALNDFHIRSLLANDTLELNRSLSRYLESIIRNQHQLYKARKEQTLSSNHTAIKCPYTASNIPRIITPKMGQPGVILSIHLDSKYRTHRRNHHFKKQIFHRKATRLKLIYKLSHSRCIYKQTNRKTKHFTTTLTNCNTHLSCIKKKRNHHRKFVRLKISQFALLERIRHKTELIFIHGILAYIIRIFSLHLLSGALRIRTVLAMFPHYLHSITRHVLIYKTNLLNPDLFEPMDTERLREE